MRLDTAINKGLPLFIDVKGHTKFFAAEVFIGSNGIVVAQPYWYDATFHPFHYIEGKVEGDGPWTVGDATVGVIVDDPSVPGSEMYTNWMQWKNFRSTTTDGRASTRKLAKQMAESEFEIKLE